MNEGVNALKSAIAAISCLDLECPQTAGADMTKAINLLSLVQAQRSLDPDGYQKYAARHGIEMRTEEVDDFYLLTELLRVGEPNDHLFDRYYVGYKIPQIGKEFDLLRFGKNYHLNIEVKSDFDPAKMQRQLCRNKYYLSYLGEQIFCVSYSSQAKKFFVLNASENLDEITAESVRELLAGQVIDETTSIGDRFKPSNYLVSPFNSPDRFLRERYFLTSQQEDVKRQILNLLGGGAPPVFVSLTGAAGTGKTLLSYDIVAELTRASRRPLIVHCGKLNAGHYALLAAGWKIIPIKEIGRTDLSAFGPILLDEAQRIRPGQFTQIVAYITSNGGQCIFSYDRSQTLADAETYNDIGARITAIPGISNFSLSEKIRTNKEIADFIKSFVNANRRLGVQDTGNIELVYFSSSQDAIQHLSSLDTAEWKVIKFTPSQYQKEHHETYSTAVDSTSHDVIGQEFDGVAVMVDEFFSYNRLGHLVYTGRAYYQPAKMLFQNMTRARSRLRLIIINNPQMLSACLGIMR